MSNNIILLFGSNGQIGHELIKTLEMLGEVIQLSRKDADLEDTDKLRYVINSIQPTIIVNAAAYTAVEQAEFDLKTAQTVNATAPKIMAEEAQKIGSILVQYSTDYVFNGKKQTSYHENDSPNPQSVYGATKLAGENNVVQSCKKHLIFRTSWVFGKHGNNFLKTILKLAAQQRELRIVSDQSGVPTSANLVADITARIIKKLSNAGTDDKHWGLYHLTAKGQTSWHGYASYLIFKALSLGFTLSASPETVIPITTADYPLPAKRPAFSCLDTNKICRYFELNLPDWKIGVDKVLTSLLIEQQRT
jgi:dTDP-4-dehydrorhamnose reductase